VGHVPVPEGGSPRNEPAKPEQPVARRRSPIRAKITSKHYGSRSFSSPIADDPAFRARLARAIGTVSPDFLEASLHQVTKAVSYCDAPAGGAEMELNAALALVQSIEPKNELEAALALQAASTHAVSMELMARVRRAGTSASVRVYGALAAKLMRAFAAQIEALERLRRGGKQTVTVEHVTVAAGAKAIIGPVTHHGDPGGQ
jgi:hypothetical protein